MVLAKIWPFFQLSSFGNIGHKNVFYDILERKNGFIRYKKEKVKKSKNREFSEGVSPWFWQKTGHLSNFLFNGIYAKTMFFMIF